MKQLTQASDLLYHSINHNLKFPEKDKALYYLGEYYIGQWKFHIAKTFLEKVDLKNLNDKKIKSRYLESLGYVNLELMLPDEAKRLIKESLTIDPENEQSKNDLSYIYKLEKDNELIYKLEQIDNIKNLNGSGIYCFHLNINNTERTDMAKYIPFIKIILQNSESKKLYGVYTYLGNDLKMCSELPSGKYKAVKLKAGLLFTYRD